VLLSLRRSLPSQHPDRSCLWLVFLRHCHPEPPHLSIEVLLK